MTRADRTLAIGALFAMLGVISGAFGAHALKAVLSPEAVAVYRTGVDYHLLHALGLLVLGILQRGQPESKKLFLASLLMIAGIVLFSGSLYALALTGVRWLGAITPLGGLCFIAAWGLIALGVGRK
jgi:uncharacterized membrane protein YgdD (TMEM256/DUF423 family)